MKRFVKVMSVLMSGVAFFSTLPVARAAELQGDVDSDGKITVSDARLAMRYAAGIDKPTSAKKKLADMDGDGVVTITDAIEILSSAIGVDLYEQELVKKGFPLSYVELLSDLHKTYPEWDFVPLVTGLDWQTSVKEERTPHSQQLIHNDVSAAFKCTCSSCDGIIKEYPNWVSASEEAVAYYMDPRNFLDEQQIFQFESTAYDSSQTQSGVEAILKGTWMYNSYITYLDASGNEVTYKNSKGEKVKYSQAVMDASKKSRMSAYYIASKIVQEVGSTSASNVGGASGKNAPYNGIYNYYNIAAYTGVSDGLKWANGNMKANKKATLYKTAATSTKLVTIPDQTQLYYIGVSGNYYKVSVTVSNKAYTGFIPKADAYLATSYGRPWTDPYKSIYYGAQYIHDSFADTQYTGYLQKFNVNPESETLYGHEYMANVRAAASEAISSYKAYTSAGILANKKTFVIPVFEKMPNQDLTREDVLVSSKPTVSATASTKTSVTLKWTSVDYADAYQVYKYNASNKKYEKVKTTTLTTYTDSTLSSGDMPIYKVRAYLRNSLGNVFYSNYSDSFYATTAPNTPTGLTLVSKDKTSVSFKWTGVDCTKYVVYRYDASSAKYTKIATTASTSYTDKTAKSGTAYKYKVRAYVSTSSQNFYSDYSSALSVTTSGTPAKEVCPYSEPTVTIRYGDSGDSVRWVQWYLYKLDYLKSTDIDGSFGPTTEKAVKSFQADAKLDVDALVGSGTRAALKNAYGE